MLEYVILHILVFTSFEPIVKLLMKLKKKSNYDVIWKEKKFSVPISKIIPAARFCASVISKMPNIAEFFVKKLSVVWPIPYGDPSVIIP